MTHESELIFKAQSGDKQAFGELALLYRKNVCGLAYRMLGDFAEAEDVTQDVFVRAFLSLGSFTQNREGGFKAWLLTITSRICIDRTRRVHYRLTSSTAELHPHQELAMAEAAESIPEIVGRAETKNSIRRAMLQLPPNYRMAVALKYLEDLDYQEISRIMQIPLGTVGTWIRRGLERLKRELETKEVTDHETSVAR